jgi:hypothetical protein
MATDAWEQAHAAAVSLWRRVRPEQVPAVQADLADLRAEVLAARAASDGDTEQALVGSWQVRLQQLLRADPTLVAELRRVLDEDLTPALTPNEQVQIGKIVMQAKASGHARVYQSGRDQTINER